ncbi:MAG: hypothetical protein K2M09_00675, partial [Muribaculaceae bacterium]|nr:hypothetical protein [Muribaculaceae bacterium]
MNLLYVTWTVRPEIFQVENLHLSQLMLFVGVLLCILWAAADVISRRRENEKWRAAGSKPTEKPDDSPFGFYLA